MHEDKSAEILTTMIYYIQLLVLAILFLYGPKSQWVGCLKLFHFFSNTHLMIPCRKTVHVCVHWISTGNYDTTCTLVMQKKSRLLKPIKVWVYIFGFPRCLLTNKQMYVTLAQLLISQQTQDQTNIHNKTFLPKPKK